MLYEVITSLEIEGHINTINQRLSKQVLSSQILNNPREYKGASAQTHVEEQRERLEEVEIKTPEKENPVLDSPQTKNRTWKIHVTFFLTLGF